MSYLYLDESIHNDAGFILISCVYFNEDPQEEIKEILASKHPPLDEYKSSLIHSNNPPLIKIRELLRHRILPKCRLAVIVIPADERSQTDIECLKGLSQFLKSNSLLNDELNVFVDEGLVKPSRVKNLITLTPFSNAKVHFNFQQDSKEIAGLQIADLAAHMASIQLKWNMGLFTKTRKDQMYDSDIEIGFEIWANLRYQFFNQGSKKIKEEDTHLEMATLEVVPYGLYISKTCSKDLSKVALKTFGTVYLGCIH